MNNPLDNPFYYLENFHRVLEWIGERYADLLSEEEHAFIAHFHALPQASRALFVRMIMRKGNLFRANKLIYAELGCAVEAARPLLPLGWIALDPVLSLDELFELLTKPEIAAAFQLSQHIKAARKPEQLAALRPAFGDPRPFSAWYHDRGDSAYQLLARPLCDRLRLIFFGNFHQDWSEFVLSDLGIYKYERVEFSHLSRGFRSRRDIEDYLALQRCKERFHASEPAHEVLQELPAGFDNEWLASRRARLLYQIAYQLEQQRDWQAAYGLYTQCSFPGARARAIRVLEKDGQYQAAYDLLALAQAAPENEAERQQLLRIAPRLRRKLGHPRLPAAGIAQVHRLDLCLPLPGHDWYVEGVVRDHLQRADAPVFYVENALINGLFGLLCWDAVFAAIPGAFFHPFHRGPADLLSADFQRRRASEFARCLDQLDSGDYQATIRDTYTAKLGTQSPFVAWEVLTEELLALALACIPAAHLKKWFERILLDVKANRSGFPDLIQFWPAERRYRMIEVKGPGDRLQDSQLRWIAYCAEHAMPISVCYLQWQEQA